MKLVALRAADYMRSASAEDRRYLLYNPVVKMKVTTQGEDVINHLWDVIAAKGFEKDTYFEMAARDIRALPKLEGTVHVNIALIVKFMENYFFHPADLPPVPRRDDPANDDFLFHQGPTRGLGRIRFHDFRAGLRPLRPAQRAPLPRADRGARAAAADRHARPRSRPPTSTSCWPWGRSSPWWSTPSCSWRTPRSTRWTGTWWTRSSTCWCATSPASPCPCTASRPPPRPRLRSACRWCARPADDPARYDADLGAAVFALRDAYAMNP